MSAESQDFIVRIYGALNARDFETLAAMTASDAVLRTTVETVHGHEGLRRWLAQIDEIFEGYTAEPGEVEEVGGYLVVPVRQRATGRASGVTVDHVFTHVVTVRDGRATELRAFTDREEALRYAAADPVPRR